MMDVQPVVQPRQIQDQTGYGVEFSGTKAVGLTTAPAPADDTGVEGDFELDPVESSQPVLSIQVLGERFKVEVDDELGVVVCHPKWSLMGCGASLAEAEKMLMEYAGDLAEAVVDDSPLEYTVEGNRLREFVLRFMYLTVD